MSVLLGLLAPSIRLVTEAARRVKCQKQLSDIGLGITMWADANRGTLPPSKVFDEVFSTEAAVSTNSDIIQSSTLMQLAHLGHGDPNNFDGLGRLVIHEYLNNASVFYCPSHDGDHPSELYDKAWVMLGDEVVINYHYRLMEPSQLLSRLDPRTTLVADGMRSRPDYNHRSGNNMLKADMSVVWYADENEYITSMLPSSEAIPGAGIPVSATWTVLDTGTPPTTAPGNQLPTNSNLILSFD